MSEGRPLESGVETEPCTIYFESEIICTDDRSSFVPVEKTGLPRIFIFISQRTPHPLLSLVGEIRGTGVSLKNRKRARQPTLFYRVTSGDSFVHIIWGVKDKATSRGTLELLEVRDVHEDIHRR